MGSDRHYCNETRSFSTRTRNDAINGAFRVRDDYFDEEVGSA